MESSLIEEIIFITLDTASVHTCLKTLLTGKDPEALECLVRIMETSGALVNHTKLAHGVIHVRNFTRVSTDVNLCMYSN